MAAQTVQERANRVQAELAALRQSTNRSAALTLLIGGLVLAALCGYFYYGYREISSVMTPDNLIDFGFAQLDSEIPNLSARIEQEVITGAPQWADQLSKQVLDGIPTARKKLEEHALKEADKTFKEVNVMTDQHFKKFVTDNRKDLDQMFKDLASDDPQKAQGHIDALEKMADRQLQKEMQDEMAEFMNTVNKAHQQLKKLKEGKKLTPEEEVERRALMITRRLQSEHLEPNKPIPGKATEATTPKGKAPAKEGENKKEK